MNTDWQAVLLDALMVMELGCIGIWFSGSFKHKTLMALSVAFLGMGTSMILLLLGDLAIAMGFDRTDFWFLSREWRALPWRYGFMIGLAIIAGVLRFGVFNGKPQNGKR